MPIIPWPGIDKTVPQRPKPRAEWVQTGVHRGSLEVPLFTVYQLSMLRTWLPRALYGLSLEGLSAVISADNRKPCAVQNRAGIGKPVAKIQRTARSRKVNQNNEGNAHGKIR